MTEPDEVAEASEVVVDGVWHWRIRNHAIGGAFSSSQAVAGDAGELVLIDPVRLAPGAMAALPLPTAICLTAKCHQRAAWRYRLDFAAAVWAPEGTAAMDGEPDRRYTEGDVLPGGLRAVHTPGPEPVHYSFLLERGGASSSAPTCSGTILSAVSTSSRRSTTTTRPRPAAAWSGCSTSRSRCSASTTGRRWWTTPSRRSAPCSTAPPDCAKRGQTPFGALTP